jgi:hypothetical protein
MLGEKATTEITKETDSQGLKECKKSAKEGGNITKNTRKEIEKKQENRLFLKKIILILKN